MRSLPRRLAVLTIATLSPLALAACGGSDDAEPTKPSTSQSGSSGKTEAADGKEITGTGYSYSVPDGWGVPAQGVPGFTPDSFAADLKDDDGFADNINVVPPQTAVDVDADQIEKSLVPQLDSAGLEEIEVQSRVDVDGSEAVHVSSVQSKTGPGNLAEQYYIAHDDQIFVVTLSFSKDVTRAERDATSDSILASWKWAS